MEQNFRRGLKPKTMKLILNNKFNEWLDSIEDDEVRKLAKNNSLISGGCIASMIAGDKINDFDIYFTNKETVLAIATYYAARSSKRATVVDFDNCPEFGSKLEGVISKGFAIDHGMSGEGLLAIYCE